jgi:cobalamin biosynthesis protein CobD/CbiB
MRNFVSLCGSGIWDYFYVRRQTHTSCGRLWLFAGAAYGLDISLNKTAVYQASRVDMTQGRSRDRSLGLNISSCSPSASRHHHLLVSRKALCITVEEARVQFVDVGLLDLRAAQGA